MAKTSTSSAKRATSTRKTKKTATRKKTTKAKAPATVGDEVAGVLGKSPEEVRKLIQETFEKSLPALIKKFDEFADDAGEWAAPNSGREYVFCPYMEWTAYQERLALSIFNKGRDLVMMKSEDGSAVFDIPMILTAIMESDLENELFSCIYIPKDAGYYDPKNVSSYMEDLTFLTRAQKLKAGYFFLRSSGGDILNAIRTFFPKDNILVKLLQNLGNERDSEKAT